MSELGIDTASYQSVAQITGAIKGGAKFNIIKATGEYGYVNGYHDAQVAATRAGKAKVGHYHFAYPGDVETQVAFFLAHAKAQPGDALALDLEDDRNPGSFWTPYSWAQRATWATVFLSKCSQASDRPILWYTNKSWHNGILGAATTAQVKYLNSVPLWIADPNRVAGKPGISSRWALHQYAIVNSIDRNYLAVPWSSLTATPAPSERKYAMLVYGVGDDLRAAYMFRGRVVTDSLVEAQNAIKRGDPIVVLGGPAAKLIGLADGVHGNVTVIVGATFHDTCVRAAQLV